MSNDELPETRSPLSNLPLDTSGGSLISGRYATACGVHWSEHEITMVFFEAKPVLIPYSDPELQARFMAAQTYTPAECVGRIIMVPDRVEALVEMLTDAIEQSREMLKRLRTPASGEDQGEEQ